MDESESSARPDESASAARPDESEPSTVALPDGRVLSYATCGDPEGEPVFCFHGVVGSRLTWSLCDEVATERGIRVVAPDRPGFGASDFQRGRRLLDWPADVAALADHLGVDSFGVAGFSGGGPHAMACAHELPGRVRGVSLVSTVTPPETRDRADPFNESVLAATRFVPGFSRAAFATAAWLAKHDRERLRASLRASAAPPDRALIDGPVGDLLVADVAEGFRRGSRGPAHDLPMVGNDWGFDVGAVDVPVTLRHGRADGTVGIELARAFADLLPAADLYVTDEAHYSTYVGGREAVLAGALSEPL